MTAASFYPARQVTPYRLWIGSKQDSRNTAAARRHGVTLVVNCTRDLPAGVRGARHHRVPVDDHADEAAVFLSHAPPTLRLIDDHLARGDAVLVHCYAGISRSASMVAAYLMFKEGLTPRQAMARVRRLKPETFGPRPNFLPALEALHPALASARRSP